MNCINTKIEECKISYITAISYIVEYYEFDEYNNTNEYQYLKKLISIGFISMCFKFININFINSITYNFDLIHAILNFLINYTEKSNRNLISILFKYNIHHVMISIIKKLYLNYNYNSLNNKDILEKNNTLLNIAISILHNIYIDNNNIHDIFCDKSNLELLLNILTNTNNEQTRYYSLILLHTIIENNNPKMLNLLLNNNLPNLIYNILKCYKIIDIDNLNLSIISTIDIIDKYENYVKTNLYIKNTYALSCLECDYISILEEIKYELEQKYNNLYNESDFYNYNNSLKSINSLLDILKDGQNKLNKDIYDEIIENN